MRDLPKGMGDEGTREGGVRIDIKELTEWQKAPPPVSMENHAIYIILCAC